MTGLLSRLLRQNRLGELESTAGEALERLRRVDLALGDLMGGEGAPPGFQPGHYLAPGVPRIRPLLVFLSAEAARKQATSPHDGQEPAPSTAQRAEDLAAAAELLHLAVVVHDAALGRQGGRRRRAARRLVGGAVGWLGGNHLTLRALELTRDEGPEIIGDMLDALREAAEGHALTQALQGRPASVREAMAHAENHTGVVFAFACRAGARLAGAERPVVSGLGRYGRHAGVAWHLAEDLALFQAHPSAEDLGQLEDRALSGRPVLAVSLAAERDPDLARLWLALAGGEARGEARGETSGEARGEGADEAAADIAERVRRSGALAEGRERLLQVTWAAKRALHTLPPTKHRNALDLLVSGLL